jgi:DNA repair ATPase RecN
LDDLQIALDMYQSDVNSATQFIVDDFGSVEGALDSCSDATKDLASQTNSFIQQLRQDLGVMSAYEGNLASARERIQQLEDEMRNYAEEARQAKAEAEAALQALRDLRAEQVADKGGTAVENPGGGSGGGNGGSGGGNYYGGYSFDELVEGIAGNI